MRPGRLPARGRAARRESDAASALGDTRRVAYSLLNLAGVHDGLGEPSRAEPLYAESLGLLAELGDRRGGIATALEGLASVACKLAADARAARLYGAAAALRAAIRVPLPPAARVEYDACLVTVRERLGESAFSAAWVAGASTPLDDVVTQAREDRS